MKNTNLCGIYNSLPLFSINEEHDHLVGHTNRGVTTTS